VLLGADAVGTLEGGAEGKRTSVAHLAGDGTDGRSRFSQQIGGQGKPTFADAAAEIGKASGRDVEYVAVTPEEYAAGAAEQGIPADLVGALTDLFHEVLDGRNAYLTDGVERALGRPPRDFADYARAAARTGVWAQ
jgi:hypothetical protein